MKISFNWLKEYVDIDLSAQQVGQILMNIGLPIESIEPFGDDMTLDVEITSNRGDCLSHIGIARELSAATGRTLRIPDVKISQNSGEVSQYVKVSINDANLCPRYTAKLIRGVKIGPSPQWVVNRLQSVGMRSVNNVVDATNLAMMETGQPTHAFDFARLKGGQIIVRTAGPDENLTAIDGTKCRLGSNMLMICDAESPVAIAGVMGGLDSEVSEKTVDVLLESAAFNPAGVRTTSRSLGISSEASFRFERYVDIERVGWAGERTIQLIHLLAGGTAVDGIIDCYPSRPQQMTVVMRHSRMKKLLGIDVPGEKVFDILHRLGFEPQSRSDGEVLCTVPSWRHDVYREVDLIEEVARHYGYDKVPVRHKLQIEVAPIDRRHKAICEISSAVQSCGFYETINVTFIDNNCAKLTSGKDPQEHLAVTDITRKNANLLRQTLIGSLLAVMQTNYHAGNRPVRVYELANCFARTEQPPHQHEKTSLAMACDSDLRFLRGVIEAAVRKINKNVKIDFVPAKCVWSDAAAAIVINGSQVGTAGVVNKNLCDNFDLNGSAVSAAELEFEKLLDLPAETIKIKPVPRFPAVERALSLILDEAVTWDKIASTINRKNIDELQEVQFQGIYRGKPIEPGKKSVTVVLKFRDDDGTLTHEQVDGFEKTILDELVSRLGATIRTI